MRIFPLFFVLSLFGCATATAQEQTDPFSTAQMHIGPLAATPAIELTNLGFDSNVFNEVENPKKDFTLTVSPQARAWLRMGRGRVAVTSRVDLVYYQQYSTERSVNTSDGVRFNLPFNRFKPFVSDLFINTRERPGYEIDARVRRVENTLTAGGTFRLGAKTDLELAGFQTKVKFDADEVFQGTALSQLLNRNETGLRTTVRYHVTPLTTFLIAGEEQENRFEFSPLRDADSVRIASGVEFQPRALIRGSAVIGFRKYDALGAGVPSYSGVVAAVNLAYTLLNQTRFSVQVGRDIAYSYEPVEPYYLQTGVTGTVTQRLTSTWDLQATAGRQRLDYRSVATTAAANERVDFVMTYGAGVGYRLSRDARLGVNVDQSRRTSDLLTRDYAGLRVGASVTYSSRTTS